MNDYVRSLTEKFNAVIREAEQFVVITRCAELQQNAIESLKGLQSEIAAVKNKAIEYKEEDLANMLLGYQCVCDSLIVELEMWILLKREEPDSAWDKLVTAQGAAMAAVRAHVGFSHVSEHYERLEAIEELVFPPQVFVSSGLIVGHLKCSICNGDYEDCEHLIGKPYMGQFCRTIVSDVKIDHVAIVDHPADKGCRIKEAGGEAGARNRMTWRLVES